MTTKNPLQFKLTFALWTWAQIRAIIAQRFSVNLSHLSLVSVGRLLARLRLLLDGFELTSRRGWQRYEDRLPGNRARPQTIATRDLQPR